MKIQQDAAKVLERTSHFLQKGIIKERPAWYVPVGVHPTGYDLTKRPKRFDSGRQPADPQDKLYKKQGEYFKTGMSSIDRRNRNNKVHSIPKIKLLEDKLRDVFYHQHPWEFARPKNLVENEGNDVKKCDWSHMLQLHKPLDGESVVQRTLYILKTEREKKNITLFDAYDQARFEFYQLRMAEEMSANVSKEESAMFGAIYPSTNMDWGVQKEQEVVDQWTKRAAEMTKAYDASSSRSSTGPSNEMSMESSSIWETSFVDEVEEK